MGIRDRIAGLGIRAAGLVEAAADIVQTAASTVAQAASGAIASASGAGGKSDEALSTPPPSSQPTTDPTANFSVGQIGSDAAALAKAMREAVWGGQFSGGAPPRAVEAPAILPGMVGMPYSGMPAGGPPTNGMIYDPTALWKASGNLVSPDRDLGGMVPTQDAADDPKALYWDPFALVQQLGFRERPSAVTYATLSSMVWRVPIVQAILQTRINQASSFATPQHYKFETGFRVKMRDAEAKPTPADKKFIRDMERMIMNCGVETKNYSHRDSFETFMRKIVRDSLTYDQANFEIVPGNDGRPAEWYAVDAATIRLADTARLYPDDDPDRVRTVQIYDNVIIAEFTAAEMAFMVRNPRTDIRSYGYGTSELEMCVSTVTAILWAWHYNQNFFCLSGDLRIPTADGLVPVHTLAGKNFQTWTGTYWREARAVETGTRGRRRTKLWNGIELVTSKDHQFWVIPRDSVDGQPVWRTQAQLCSEDCVLLDTRPIHGSMTTLQTLEASAPKVLISAIRDPVFWEYVGFTLCDGHWPDTFGSPIATYGHFECDEGVRAHFEAAARRWGLPLSRGVTNRTVTRSDGVAGYPRLELRGEDVIRWFYSIGFKPSSSGKRIPDCVFQLPIDLRAAFLRGVMSADGHRRRHKTGYCTPTVHKTDRSLRQDILLCLWSIGVAANEVGEGWDRQGEITVQNVGAFDDQVRYLQAYKNTTAPRSSRSISRWDILHPAVSRCVAIDLKASSLYAALTRREKDYVRHAAAGRLIMSRPRAIALLRRFELSIPDVLHYHHVPVDVLDVVDQGDELMYDVEVFDDEHVFLANGVAVHNSQGSVAKGLLNLKGAIPEKQLRAFRRQWYQMVSGIENAWRTPITNAEEVQWVDMHTSNRDMEFSAWMDFLIKVVSSVYVMDPVEINFKYGTTAARCYAPSTELLLFDGSVRRADQIAIGDQLMGPDSTPRNVTKTVVGRAEMYEIIPSRGEPWQCTGNHELTLISSVTNNMIDICVVDYLDKPKRFRQEYKLFQPDGIEFPARQAPKLDPYFYGLWVGDGSKDHSQGVVVTTMDPEIVDALIETADVWGLTVNVCSKGGRANGYRLTGTPGSRDPNPVRAILDVVWTDGRIDDSIKLGSWETRMRFLAGFLDADGYLATHGYFTFTQKNQGTFDDVVFIARSLGFKVICQLLGTSWYNRRTGEKRSSVNSHATISGSIHAIPTRILRKRADERVLPRFDPRRTGFTVQRIADDVFAGFETDGDHRHLLADFTVSHNSMFEGAQRAKSQESRERGLKPLLRAVGREIDRSIIWPINPEFTIEFLGLESQTPKELADLMTQRVRTMYTINEIRSENDMKPLADGLGDIILDANWMNARSQLLQQQQAEKQAAQQQQMQMQALGGVGGGGVNELEAMLAQLEGKPPKLGAPGSKGSSGSGGPGAAIRGAGKPVKETQTVSSKPGSIPSQTPKQIAAELQGEGTSPIEASQREPRDRLSKSVIEITL